MPTLLKEFNNDKKNNLRWLVFDGKLEDDWSMPLVNALEEQRKLILKNRSNIRFDSNNSLFFETNSIENSNPYIISKIGIINVARHDLDVTVQFAHWISNKLPRTLNKLSFYIQSKFNFYWAVID